MTACEVNNVRHSEMYIAEVLIPEHNISEVGIAIEKFEQ
jgi:hypothetical protein